MTFWKGQGVHQILLNVQTHFWYQKPSLIQAKKKNISGNSEDRNLNELEGCWRFPERQFKLKPSYCAGLEIETKGVAKVTNFFHFAEHYVYKYNYQYA